MMMMMITTTKIETVRIGSLNVLFVYDRRITIAVDKEFRQTIALAHCPAPHS